MICYKDKTFCHETTCVSFKDGSCDRALTDKVMKDAEAFGLPISRFAVSETIKPDCYEPTSN